MPPEYTFLPWLRRGLAAAIAVDDDLGSAPDAATPGRPTLQVELTLDVEPAGGGAPSAARPTVEREVSLLGPADVGALKQEAILRLHPPDGALGVTPGELAYVEFYDEDLPWRYTPARAVASKLRPWLALLVMTVDEVERRTPARGATLGVVVPKPATPLPAVTETWAWAHAQLPGAVGAAGVGALIAAQPDLARSRLLCPRRLEPETAYQAFLVPAFEAGRLAALGRRDDALAAPALQPAWGQGAGPELPVFAEWRFTTGLAGDFETLVRRLVPRVAGPEFGARRMDVSAPGFAMTPRPGAESALEGALVPPSYVRQAFPGSPGAAVAAQLRGILDAGAGARDGSAVPDDPLVLPPAYGLRHAGVPLLADAQSDADLAWLAELNEDPRSRAAAGLGAQVVRERQDEYVQRAWEQVGDVEAANQRLREAELARASADALLRKHVAQAGDDDRVLLLTAPALSGLSVPAAGATTSIRGAVDASRVPSATLDPAFRKVTRPQRPLVRRLAGAGDVGPMRTGLLGAMNADQDPLTAAPPMAEPAAGVALDDVAAAVRASATRLAAQEARPNRVFVALLDTELRARRDTTPPADLGGIDLDRLRAALADRVTARFAGAVTAEDAATAARVQTLVDAIVAVAADGDPDAAVVTVGQVAFAAEFGDDVAGRARIGLRIVGDAPPPGARVAGMASAEDAAAFAAALDDFRGAVAAAPVDGPGTALAAPATLAGRVLNALAPQRALGNRLAAALPVVAGRPVTDPGRLGPVMAHPRFRDPMFEPLRRLSQDHIVPNLAGLAPDSLTLLETNPRFIEAYTAGLNHELAKELLWREYPTDQRGSYFQVFWDTRDALDAEGRDDVSPLHTWAGALGTQSPSVAGLLVLVVRGELLVRFPGTVVFAQRAAFDGGDPSRPRVLEPAGEIRHPVLHARLDPDVTLVGFDLTEEQARGHRPAGATDPLPPDPGWLFVLMERPGEARFGLDDATPPAGLRTWDDLAWDALTASPSVEVAANAALAPTALPAGAPAWGRTAADMAAILLQSPVLMARHASEMLP